MPSWKYPALGHRLPQTLAVPLFGDRQRYGQKPFLDDPTWREWLQIYAQFHMATQHSGVRKIVNHSGYKVMTRLDLEGKRVLEIGPGPVAHMSWWNGRPTRYDLLDSYEGMMTEAISALAATDIPHSAYLQSPDEEVPLPMASSSYDAVVSFYSMEHLHPLERYVAEIVRVLKPGGHLIGAIPCEGGLGWGLGRFFSTRRWFKKHSTIDPDKWVCWEHPNFSDTIVKVLDASMQRVYISLYPLFFIPLIDLNLILRFVYAKR